MLTLLLLKVSAQTTKATYYFSDGPTHPGCAPVQTFHDGLRYGPCLGDDGESGVLYGPSSKYWAAVANGRDHCGKNIRMCYGSNCIKLVVKDSCIACESDGHVDFGLEALVELTGSDENACAINKLQPQVTWEFDGTFSTNEVKANYVAQPAKLKEDKVYNIITPTNPTKSKKNKKKKKKNIKQTGNKSTILRSK
jgi:hypothetical protein